ncbi:Glycosyltransferase Family 34 protein [Glomus cerebriforme]|uniref:Glycosyltransferase Family 34 protein n=1 Tax=Glomus cerebriforme TaxID=658196 RepID=A0A397TFC2_9GLOM|nr:Glycosyltransferase Family 34 protein [Glomus cerebriforme]
MGIEGQSNYLANYAKYQFRKLRLFPLLITAFVIFLLTIPYYINDYNNLLSSYNTSENDNEYTTTTPTTPTTPLDNPVQNMSCPHYKTALFISSVLEDVDKRMLMREELFGITDNLIPCMKQDTLDIFYKFFVRKSTKKPSRLFLSEQMEYYHDIVEIDIQNDFDWHQSLLEYAQSLQEKCITFDHLIIIDIFTMINLEKIQDKISSSKIGNQMISDTRKIVWGSFNSNRTENMAVIIGSSAIKPILNNLDHKLNYTSLISSHYLYHNKHPNKKIPDDLIFINDPTSIIEWPNSIKSIFCVDCVVAIGHVYQDWEIRKIKNDLNISTTIPCNARLDLKMYSNETSKLRPSIAVMTSSFLYKDNCMVEAAPLSAQNKREYAERHGYAFVPRSTEYAQQHYRKRKPVWGKVDAVEKVLPYYEWLLWIDMDAFVANRSLSVEHLFEMCEKRVGGKEAFKKINFIVAKPVGDNMINAGVFLIRNTDWSRDFLRSGVQSRYDRATTGMKEQQAIRDAIKQPQWKPNVLFLDRDDHTINTFPDRYIRGDYIVHYAPEEGCPASPVLRGLSKLKMLEESPSAKILLPF